MVAAIALIICSIVVNTAYYKLAPIIGAYAGIEDNYPKYVLSMDKFDMSRNGIIYRIIIDFLLKKTRQN